MLEVFEDGALTPPVDAVPHHLRRSHGIPHLSRATGIEVVAIHDCRTSLVGDGLGQRGLTSTAAPVNRNEERGDAAIGELLYPLRQPFDLGGVRVHGNKLQTGLRPPATCQ